MTSDELIRRHRQLFRAWTESIVVLYLSRGRGAPELCTRVWMECVLALTEYEPPVPVRIIAYRILN